MSLKPAVALRRPSRTLIGAAVALLGGLALAWLDTRPNWDDTGISVGLLLIGAAVAGQIGAPWWLAGGLMAAPLLFAELGSDWSLLIVVPIALAGGFAGDYLRRLTRRR